MAKRKIGRAREGRQDQASRTQVVESPMEAAATAEEQAEELDEFEGTEQAVVRSEGLPDGSIAYFDSEFAAANMVRERGV